MTGLDVEAVLSQHQPEGISEHYCSCSDYRLDVPWAAHVAAVLRVEIESALADAWDEGRQAGITSAVDCRFATPNPYRPTLAATEGDRQ